MYPWAFSHATIGWSLYLHKTCCDCLISKLFSLSKKKKIAQWSCPLGPLTWSSCLIFRWAMFGPTSPWAHFLAPRDQKRNFGFWPDVFNLARNVMWSKSKDSSWGVQWPTRQEESMNMPTQSPSLPKQWVKLASLARGSVNGGTCRRLWVPCGLKTQMRENHARCRDLSASPCKFPESAAHDFGAEHDGGKMMHNTDTCPSKAKAKHRVTFDAGFTSWRCEAWEEHLASISAASVKCAHGRKSIWRILFLLCRDLYLLRLDVCICGCIGMGFVFAVSSRCRELVSEVCWVSLRADKVQEKLQVHPCTVACASFHRSGCRFWAGLVLFFRCIPSELNYSEKGSRFSLRLWPEQITSSCSDAALHTIFTGTDMRPRLLFLPGWSTWILVKPTPTSPDHVPAMSVQSCHNRMISLFAQDMLRLSHIQALFIVKKKKRLHSGHVFMGPLTWCGLHLACLDRNFWMHLRFGGPHLEWYWSPPRTESRSCHCKLSELLCFGPILQTSTLVESKTLPKVCNTLPVARCGDMTETFDRFKRSRTARANSCVT